MKAAVQIPQDGSAEEKIKEAARRLFTQKGFAATKTRDIAEAAGINMALLHYYFRSKEKLFEMIMLENLQQFVRGIKDIFNSEVTSLEEKIQAFISKYIDLLIGQPDLPLFIFSEIRSNPKKLISKMGIKEFLLQSVFMKQFQQTTKANKVKLHPLHFIMNIVALTVFPFIGQPILQSIGDLDQEAFSKLMQDRKKLIPQWIGSMLQPG